MIVLDVETTGTDPHLSGILSIGAIDFNNPEDTFYNECRVWDGAHVIQEALDLNGFTKEQIGDPKKKSDKEITEEFFKWLERKEDHTIAGLHPSFDMGFIQHTCLRNSLNYPLARRSIDQHSILYFHMLRRGLTPPLRKNRSDIDSTFISTYVGIPPEPKPHIALNGAKWEAEAFSRLIHEKSMFPEFKKHPIPWLS
jgi:DNA polymerase III epsilon subunit-like protein